MKSLRRICIYCASSRTANQEYYDAAFRLGKLLAEQDITVVYGGGSLGSMGAVADGSLKLGGKVVGVLPKFMNDLEWGHPGLTELRLVDDMHERKRVMIEGADAVIALPGGCGTLEELLEAVTWKRLGLFLNPIVLLNTRAYFAPLLALLENAIEERFMDERHREMWQVVDRPEDVLPCIQGAADWSEDARDFAVS